MSHETTLNQVPPVPVDEDEFDDVEEPDAVLLPEQLPDQPAKTLDRMPSMTDVLNSSPDTPVSPQRTSTSPTILERGDALSSPKPLSISDNIDNVDDDDIDTEHAPSPPPRPLSPFSQAEKTLQEMFPNIDRAVVKAILIASAGQLDPAFNALLSMSDPAAVPDLPPRPAQTAAPVHHKQVEADEAYARQLAAELNGQQHPQHRQPRPQRRQPTTAATDHEHRQSQRINGRPDYSDYDGSSNYYDQDKDWSFFDDDLPVIKENLSQTFNETKDKINGWVANIRKKIESLDDTDSPTDYYSSSSTSAGQGRVYSRSARPAKYDYKIDRNNSYDNDPTELDGNFSHLTMADDSGPPPPKPARPHSTMQQARSAIDAAADEELYTGPARKTSGVDVVSSPTKSKKWEPLKNGKWEPLKEVAPMPDKDPFFIGDGDSEDEATTTSDDKQKQVRFEVEEDDVK
ncbi:hypothetical protein V1512DRAFT_260296 [Lipomyces arxii]|uniref:uncharacterized protein n=1 Tax=Lipomyces arxii TaxID=56418 RepID=UPI0034CD27DA